MRGIIRVDNNITQEIYVASTGDIDKYKENVVKYKNSGKTPPNNWVKAYGVGCLTITPLEEMTEYDFGNSAFVKSKKKQWTYHLLEAHPDLKIINPYEEQKKKEGSTKIQYNGAYEDIMMKLDDIGKSVERIEEKIDAKLGK